MSFALLPSVKPVIMLVMRQSEIRNDLNQRIADQYTVHVVPSLPPLTLIRKVCASLPNVLVLELSYGGPMVARVVATLKETCPSTRIILYSSNSQEEDAPVIEEGVYYYAAGVSGDELSQVVRAALRSREESQS
ncbi:MAG: hypothetical protein HY716_08365 [Planctomycetes bacterium]|nr:hypothetical protein [Planctomycetota bacterium]